jgi:N-acetylmuramoyl-L-alanine amidase
MLAAILAVSGLVAVTGRDPAMGAVKGQPEAAGTCDPHAFKIAVDVGHTPEAPGATSARGITEYVFNLRLAKEIAKALVDAGFYHVTLTTMRGVGHPQLLARTARANHLGVDLFMAVHHDDVQTVFHRNWTYEGKTYPYSDRNAGFSLFVSGANTHLAESTAFAKLLGAALIARGLQFTTHHAEDIPGEHRPWIDPNLGIYRYDDLVVLKDTTAPAVLLEAGVIVNRTEESRLASPQRQQQIAAAAVEATTQFCMMVANKRP